MFLEFKINKTKIGNKHPTYFVADIAANHDGSIKRAIKLVRLAKKAGANAVKFQHFKTETIVLDSGFKKIGKLTHQAKWKKSVFETYKDASINPKWTKILFKECKKIKIDFFTAPYDLNYVDDVKRYIPAYKIGSGDITWKEIIIKIAKKGKPVLLATGASTLKDVVRAINTISKYNKNICLMQCNTNYTNSPENMRFVNLNVLKQYKKIFGNKVILGLSDHTQGHDTVLGSVCFGAKVIEKHFTDDNNRSGPDHKFSMNPKTWRLMVNSTRNLELAMGNGNKNIELNELQSLIVQRRGVWANRDMYKGEVLDITSIKILRPCPKNSIDPFNIEKYFGKTIKKKIKKNDLITSKCFQ